MKQELKELLWEWKKCEVVVLRVVTDTGTEVKCKPGTTNGTTDASNKTKGLVDPPGMVILSPGSGLASDLTVLEQDLAKTLCKLQIHTCKLLFILAWSQLVRAEVTSPRMCSNAVSTCGC